MALTLLSIPVFLLIIALIHFGWPWTWFASRSVDLGRENSSEKHHDS